MDADNLSFNLGPVNVLLTSYPDSNKLNLNDISVIFLNRLNLLEWLWDETKIKEYTISQSDKDLP